MTLVKWKPARNLDFFNNFDRLFNDIFSRPSGISGTSDVDMVPDVDVTENDKEYKFSVEVPGVDKKDIEILFKDGILTFKGEKKVEKQEEKDNYRSREISYGKFERSYRLAEGIDESKIAASYKNGILAVVVPKVVVPEKTPKKIEIK